LGISKEILPILDAIPEDNGFEGFQLAEYKPQINNLKDHRIKKFLNQNRHVKDLTDITRILEFKAHRNGSSREISLQLRIPQNRVSYILRKIKDTRAENLCRAFLLMENDVKINNEFKIKLEQLLQESHLKTNSLKEIHSAFVIRNTDMKIRNFQHFYSLCVRHDFRYKNLQYKQPYKDRWTPTQKKFALSLSFELFSNERSFDVLWIDESTVCPQNFQKKGWGFRGKELVIESKLRYDGIKIFGMMSRSKIEGIQFIHDSSNHLVFDNFVIECIKRYLRNKNDRSVPVFFLDNANIHKSKDLLRFCKDNNILMVFNLAYYPVLNPIELLWRFLKQPFKRMTNISGPYSY
jgi:hypothetical protein